MAMTNAEKQKAFHKRQLEQGKKKYGFYLTPEQAKQVKEYIKTLD